MAQYPRRHAQVAALVNQIIGGITEHPDYFPHCDPAPLAAAQAEFLTANNELVAANARLAQTAKGKRQAFQQLETVMKQQLKLAQVDCSADPVRLSCLGWASRRDGAAVEPPDQPMELQIADSLDHSLTLHWGKPSRNYHRPINCYQIYRRAVASPSGPWQLAGTAMEEQITLTHQPTGRLEYQVTALNRSGESLPSNRVTVLM
jgi:hypothetical protein